MIQKITPNLFLMPLIVNNPYCCIILCILFVLLLLLLLLFSFIIVIIGCNIGTQYTTNTKNYGFSVNYIDQKRV